MIRSFLKDQRGESTANFLGFALTWFIAFFTFLMNVQLGQLFYRRDVVDHAAAVATDTAKKTYCAKNESSSATEQEAKRTVQPVLDSAGGNEACQLTVNPGGDSGSDEGAKGLEVQLKCSFSCNIPIASLVMCKGGKSQLEAKLKTVALGCDGKGS